MDGEDWLEGPSEEWFETRRARERRQRAADNPSVAVFDQRTSTPAGPPPPMAAPSVASLHDAPIAPGRPDEHTPLRPHRLLATRWGRLLVGAVLALFLATIVGLLALWPHGAPPHVLGGSAVKSNEAKVTATHDIRCPGPTNQSCRQLTIQAAGRAAKLTLGPAKASPSLNVGQHIRVQKVDARTAGPKGEPFTYVGLDRRRPLLVLAGVFALLVVLLTRWRGVFALGGFALSLLLVTRFVVPAIGQGSSPLAVAIVGSLAVMFVTVGLTYGFSPQSAAAVLGIAASLLLAGLLGSAIAHAAHLDGFSSEYSTVLGQADKHISLQGIVIAGMVIGALGVLADMAVTQASAVMALRRANPEFRGRALFSAAFGVGRDHLVATTHTLVLAYVGATLPLLLVLYAVRTGTADAFNSEDIAEPVAATLVGAIVLLISVPVTTALATVLTSRAPVESLPEDHHGHAH